MPKPPARKAPKKEVPAEGLGEVLDFMKLLWAVNHGLEASSKQLEARTGVTGPQRLVIRLVGKYPGVTAGRLADILHLHPSTLTGVLRRLEQRGMLERKADPADARRALKKALRKLKPADLRAAQYVLETIASALEPEEE
jgi:DNA-binding MarR family transcriptional regulator